MGENFPKPDIPPNFAGDFFPTIRRLKNMTFNIEDFTLKNVYNFLMTDGQNGRDRILSILTIMTSPRAHWPP